MINLIPNEDKKEMSKDFYLRLTALVFVMLGFSFLVVSIAIFPAYFVASTQGSFYKEKLRLQESEVISPLDQNTLTEIKDLQSKLSLIENAKKNQFIFSEKVLNKIILSKMQSIKITGISYENNSLNDKKVKIDGLAPSREVLLLFRRALEDNPAFSKVDLPISNFVKGSNIKFSLSLIPRPNDDSVGQASQ